VSDTTSDHGRIARQQYFVKQAMKRAIERGARNPVQLSSLIGVAQQYVAIDDTLDLDTMLDLGSRFDDFDPEALQVFEPYTYGDEVGGASVLRLDERASKEMFDVFRGIDPTLNVNASVRVRVENGTGSPVAGQDTADGLRRAGFTVTETVDAASFRNERTVVRHAPGGGVLAAVVVARYVDVDAELVEDPALASGDATVAVVVGRDLMGVRSEPRALAEFERYLPVSPETTASSSGGAAGSADEVPPPPAAQSFVPEPPPGVTC
jgi:hypothetical protein